MVGGGVALFGLVFCVLAAAGLYLWYRHDAGVASSNAKFKVKDVAKNDLPAKQAIAGDGDKNGDVQPLVNPAPLKVERSGKPLSGSDVYNRLLKSAVWINNPNMGWGTGMLVNAEDKLVVTNYHVVYRSTPLIQLDTLKTIEA